MRLPGMSGLEVQGKLNETGTQIPIIFVTSHGDIPMTVKAMKAGAVEFLTQLKKRHAKLINRARA